MTWIGRDALGRITDFSAESSTSDADVPPNITVTGGDGAVEQTVLTRSVTLTDAQIKALPTTPVELVPAPGAGQVLIPVSAVAVSEFSANDYTNVDAEAFMMLLWGNTIASTKALIGDLTWFDAFGGPGQGRVFGFIVAPTLSLLDTTVISETGRQDIDDEPINLFVQNGSPSDGNFTGGNAANTLKVTVAYYVFDL